MWLMTMNLSQCQSDSCDSELSPLRGDYQRGYDQFTCNLELLMHWCKTALSQKIGPHHTSLSAENVGNEDRWGAHGPTCSFPLTFNFFDLRISYLMEWISYFSWIKKNSLLKSDYSTSVVDFHSIALLWLFKLLISIKLCFDPDVVRKDDASFSSNVSVNRSLIEISQVLQAGSSAVKPL